MLYLTCTTITNVDLAHYGVFHAKNWVSVDCGTSERLSMVCAPVRGDNPRALARGLSTVQVHKPCSISLVPQ